MMPLICVMRLWRDGHTTPIWSGYSLVNAWKYIQQSAWRNGRIWIELDHQPQRQTVAEFVETLKR